MSVGMAMLNAEKGVKTKETAAKKVLDFADRKHKRIQKKSVNGMNLFLGLKGR